MKTLPRFHALTLLLLLAACAGAEVNSPVDHVAYDGNGTTKAFTFAFGISLTTDLRVVLRTEATGVGDLQVLNSDYTMADNDSDGDYWDGTPGGSVTFTAAPAAGVEVHLSRAPPLTQTSDIDGSDYVRLGTIEDAVDKIVCQVQYLRGLLYRVPLIPETERQVLDFNLPSSVDRANSTFTFDANGQPEMIAGTIDPNTITVAAFWETILDDLSLAASLTSLGIGTAAGNLALRESYDPGTYNVGDYGAVGDGVTDDTAASQAAIDAADGLGTVFFPAGTYKLTAPLNVPLGSTLRGSQAPGLNPSAGAILYQSDSTEDCILNLSSSDSHSIEIAYLTLRGPGEAEGTVDGIRFDGASAVYSSHFHHLYIEDCSGDAFDLDDAFSLEIDQISTDDIGGWAYNGDTGPGTHFHDWTFIKASTGGLWCWAGTPTLQSINVEDVPIGLKFGNSSTGQTCLPNLYNINIEPFTDTGIWFNQGRPEYMHGITMYAKASTAVNKGVYFDASNYGAFVTHACVNFTAQSGGSYTNTYFADNGAISSIPIYVYDSDGTVAGMNSYMIKDSVVLYGESGDPTDGGIMAIGGTLQVDHTLRVQNGSTSAGYIDLYEDSDDGSNYARIRGQALAADATSYLTYRAVVDLTNTQIKDLADTPVELVAAPGAGTIIEVESAAFYLDYGSNVLAEPSAPDDLALEYDGGTGAQIATWDSTGFITSNADAVCVIHPGDLGSGAAAVTAAANVNKNVVLLNTGGDYTGNAGNDTVIRVIVHYRVHDGLGL